MPKRSSTSQLNGASLAAIFEMMSCSHSLLKWKFFRSSGFKDYAAKASRSVTEILTSMRPTFFFVDISKTGNFS